MEGISKPLLALQNMYAPYQWCAWSRTHATVLVALNRKQCEIWDLRRSILEPVSIHTMETSYNTLAELVASILKINVFYTYIIKSFL